jgi:hypothetical protein
LDEEINPGAMAHWQRILQESSAKEVALGFFSTKQFNQLKLTDSQFIIILYRTVLDRSAAAEEKAALQSKLGNGSSRESIVKNIIDSQEFADLLAGNNTTVVTPDEKPIISEDAPEQVVATPEDQTNDTADESNSVTYANSGDGSFTYDSNSRTVKVQSSSNRGKKFSHTLDAAEQGTFSFNIKTIQKNADTSSIELRLIQDNQTYYRIINRDGSKTGGIAKYVNGVRVDKSWFSKGYEQDKDYNIRVTFSPSATMVEAFGQVLMMNSDSSVITVNSFSVNTIQQNANYSNIDYSIGEAGENHAPGAANDFASVEQDSFVDINVVANDKDIDGNLDASSVVIVKKATHAELSVSAGGIVGYMPKSGFTGTDSFTYTVSDSYGTVSRTATVAVKVSAPADETTAVDNETPAPNDDTSINPEIGADSAVSPYLEPINLPKCDASNPEVQFIRSKADWKMINSKNKRIFCVSPGDYRSLTINITTSGTAKKKRYIVLNNGNDIHPAKLPLTKIANYALVFKDASHWVVDRMAGVNPNAKRLVDFRGTRNGTHGSGSTHNIINRLYASNMGSAVRFGTNADKNTLQNSRIEEMRLTSRKNDVMAIIIEDNIDNTPSMTITNTKIINNEIVNANDGIHVGRHRYSGDGGLRQAGNIAGTIIDSNHIYITSDIYTDGKGRPDPKGRHAYAEDGIDMKIGSDDSNNPVIVSNNHLWGFRKSDTTGSHISSYGTAIGTHHGVYNIKILNNVIFDAGDGISGASGKGQDEPYAMLNGEIKHNLLYQVGPFTKGLRANPLRFSLTKNIDASKNVIIDSRDDYVMVASSRGDVCVHDNIIINQANGQTAEVRNNSAKLTNGINQCLQTNTFYASTAAAGYTEDYTFVTDKFTNTPRVIRLKNVMKSN